jgi:hypothetical protein
MPVLHDDAPALEVRSVNRPRPRQPEHRARAGLPRLVALVVLAALTAGLAGCGGKTVPSSVPPLPSSLPATSPATFSATPTASPSPTLVPAISFVSDGELIAGWYWLRDTAQERSALWSFPTLPAGQGDITLRLEMLATDRVNGPRGIPAAFFVAWATPAAGGAPGPWLGRLPVTLPNVSLASDPVGYTCAGTLVSPRATLAAATSLVIQVSRADPHKELPPVTTHVAVCQQSIQIQP